MAAEDEFKNVDTAYTANVSVRVAGDPSFAATVQADHGVATFAGLSVSTGQSGQPIEVSAVGLTGTATNPLSVTSPVNPPAPPPGGSAPSPPAPPPANEPAPLVVLERLVKTEKTNRKGKPVGKPVFKGFYIQFSEPMNPATADLAADYQVLSSVVKKVKRSKITKYQHVSFAVSYSPALDAVTLTVKSASPFGRGGEIKIAGVTSQAGVALSASDTVFTILVKAKGISLA